MVCVPGINAIVVGTLIFSLMFILIKKLNPHTPCSIYAVNLNKPRLPIICVPVNVSFTARTALPQEVNLT